MGNKNDSLPLGCYLHTNFISDFALNFDREHNNNNNNNNIQNCQVGFTQTFVNVSSQFNVKYLIFLSITWKWFLPQVLRFEVIIYKIY